jgi:hypothetical protein
MLIAPSVIMVTRTHSQSQTSPDFGESTKCPGEPGGDRLCCGPRIAGPGVLTRQDLMPAADQPTRGRKTSCLPGSPAEDERSGDDPERGREFLDRPLEITPELFPSQIRRGDRRRDLSTSPKSGGKFRRIDLRDHES